MLRDDLPTVPILMRYPLLMTAVRACAALVLFGVCFAPSVAFAATAHLGGWSITGLTVNVATVVNDKHLANALPESKVREYVNNAAELVGYTDAHLKRLNGKIFHSSLETIRQYDQNGRLLVLKTISVLVSFFVLSYMTSFSERIFWPSPINGRSRFTFRRRMAIAIASVSSILIVIVYFYQANMIEWADCTAEVSRRAPFLLWAPLTGLLLVLLITRHKVIDRTGR